MGVRGLTTFMKNRSHLYLKRHELHDCNIVLDGNSIAEKLYKKCRSNDSFGGDYDKFAHYLHKFFDLLSQCNITAYVILDGGYEKHKLTTVISRMKNKINAATDLNPSMDGFWPVNPLFLREVFVDVVLSLGLKVVRCKFESDMEIAGIAQALECPVVSYDSNFYVFGCDYVPLDTMPRSACKGNPQSTKNPYTYLACEIYHIDNFFQEFGGLDRNNLPLLAVLIGNNYVKGSLFNPFFKNLRIQKRKNTQIDQQKKIKRVIKWLQNESLESAINTLLGRFKDAKRQLVLRKIQAAMKGYFDSELLEYLEITARNKQVCSIDFDKCSEAIPPPTNEIQDHCRFNSENDDSSSEKSEFTTEDQKDLNVEIEEHTNMTLFYKNFQKCQYPSCFMDMVILNRYYCMPQVEDSSSAHSHSISLDILAVIHKILTSKNKDLTVVCRSGNGRIKHTTLPSSNEKLPTLDDISNLSIDDRKQVLINILQVDSKFVQTLELFPIEWHLFLISLKYFTIKGPFDNPLIYSCIVCFIILNYVDVKVGFYRFRNTFDKQFASFLIESKNEISGFKFESFKNLPYRDCVVFIDKMMSYFQMDKKLESNSKLYDRILVHSMSQIQSVFLHVKYLNSLLNNCYSPLQIHKIFNGTFIYNLTANLRKRRNILKYLELLLKDCPSILAALAYVLGILENQLNSETKPQHSSRRHKKKKHKKHENNVDEEKISENEE